MPTYCLSDSYQGTFYYSGPFETGNAENYSLWNRGFYQQRYGFKGNSICNSIALDHGRRLLAALNEGARTGGRKVVDTGWKYDPATVATKPAAPKDADPEPAPRPAAARPTDKVYLADAIDNTRVDNWVNKRGQAQHLDQKVINCVSQNVIVTLQKKPQATHLADFYKDAVAACSK